MCGTGVATSTIVTNKVKEWLKEKELTNEVKLYQSKVADEMNKIDDYDIVVSTTVVPDSIKDKSHHGIAFIDRDRYRRNVCRNRKENQRIKESCKMLVTTKEMFDHAEEFNYAIPAANFLI